MQKDVVDLSKHYMHEIDALVSLDRAECFALEKKKTKKLHSSSKIVSLRSLRFCGIQIYKINFVCRVIYARVADLFVYGHSPLYSYMPDDIVGREH